MDSQSPTAEKILPGVPAGSPATGAPPVNADARDAGRPVPPSAPAAKLPFGGNVGGRVRADGLKPGSPEAKAADRQRDAERKRRERAEQRAAATPPPLPPVAGGAPVDAPGAPEISAVDAGAGVPSTDLAGAWCAEDFKAAAPELVELLEAWRVHARTKQAAEKKCFTASVVEAYGKRAAFPAPAKRSLSNSSPPLLADMFNALKVPASIKPAVTTVPALVYLIVRDVMIGIGIETDAVAEKKSAAGDASSDSKPATNG